MTVKFPSDRQMTVNFPNDRRKTQMTVKGLRGSSENTRIPFESFGKTNHYEMSLLQRKNANQVLHPKPRSDL